MTPFDMHFDFGCGKLAAVTHGGRSWARLDDLVRFLGGDRAVMYAETHDSSLGEKLHISPSGEVLLPWECVPVWMFVVPTTAIGPEHRDGHTAWCRAFLESDANRKLSQRLIDDLGLDVVALD